ncbi:RDD family protein [Tabrizicola sp.]|uniref:RDD family protein n=1 Tax=Tabrizicola sp. TaxID=2005166 RepID=UPI003F3C32CE
MKLFRSRRDRPSPDTVMSPEGVPLTLRIAGIGVRLAAQITDVLITVVASGCILIILSLLELVEPQTLLAIGSMLFFVTRVPYYIVTELIWNGQTLGKRLMKIKVVSHDGRSLTTHAIVLRNLMKEAEIFLPGTLLLTLDAAAPIASLAASAWVVMAFLIPLLSPYRQRLGDILAGTHVIHLPQPVLLKDLARDAPVIRQAGAKITFLAHQLDHYGAFELQTLEGLLRAEERQMSPAAYANHRKTQAEIIEKIRRKIGYADPVPPEDQPAFLKAFYTAQRAHLEQRQLFGDRRADKHHARLEPPA